MPDWKHNHCGLVVSAKLPPVECPRCPADRSGWLWLGETPKHRLHKIRYGRKYRRRERVFARDGYRCVECGATENLTLDHWIPKSKGGSSKDENLRAMCATCNRVKADTLPDQEPVAA